MSKFTTSHASPLHLRDTHEMIDHTSGYTLTHWLAGTSAPIPEYPQISKNDFADVVVVGAGMAGLSVAYHLQNEGKSVIVLEDGMLMSGESGRTTAHLMSALDDRFYELEKTFGLETASLAYQSHAAAIDRIEEIVMKENIDCCFERLDGYLIQSPKHDIGFLKKEYEAAVRVGFKGVEWVNQAPVPGINTGECIRFPNQGQFNPVKYATALARIITSRGGKIFSHSKVTEFHTLPKHHLSTEDPYVVTHNGFKVSYKHLAVCTNVPVNDRITFYTKMEPHRSYVVCAKIPKGTVPKCLVWDTSEPYNYVRTAEIDGDTLNDVLIIGGQDHKTGQAFDFDERISALEKWARERWPTMGAIECYWSGQVIEPADMLQYIGRNPGDEKNVYVVTGDSGTGMTSTTIGGMLISDLIMGRTNPWAHIYDPSRKPVHAITEFVKMNVTANVYGFGAYFTPSEVHDIEDIPRGCGALLREGVAKHAIYKDEQGNVTKLSSVCPHLKACVQWNSFEKSWDCPAHGSRFDPYGRVINGPANSNLECLSSQPKPLEKATTVQQQAHPEIKI